MTLHDAIDASENRGGHDSNQYYGNYNGRVILSVRKHYFILDVLCDCKNLSIN
jgi:hypothetical protein